MMTSNADSAYAYLVEHNGMHPDPDLLKLFDLSSFYRDPGGFAAAAKEQAPYAFKGGSFEGRTATKVERDAWLKEHERNEIRQRYERVNARFYADYAAKKGR